MVEHLGIALLIQLPLARLHSWTAGTVAAAAWAISREITQAEYRWIEQFGEGRRANMPWWGGFDAEVWHADALLDWIVPCTMAIALALFMRRREAQR